MFGFFSSQEKKTRENAANWLELADKVWHFRRDRLTDRESGELLKRSQDLRQQLKAKADAATLKLSVEGLESILRKTGGAIYPKSSLVENVEFFLVAAIVIIGIRTYFVQPFKIPTNSMWPTYFGMTAENFPPEVSAPGTLERIFRFAAFGAQRREMIAPTSGKVSADFRDTGNLHYTVEDDRSWLILPTKVREYTLYVNDQPAKVRVPYDFNDFDSVVLENFFASEQDFLAQFKKAARDRAERRQRNSDRREDYAPVFRLQFQKEVRAGEPVVQFDILTGDQLFVDRVSYHFTQPKVGQGFVFRTDHIPGIGDEQYYIKRLVGTPGDVMEIQPPVLYRNGKPIAGAEAFAANERKEGRYRGYFNAVPGQNARSEIEYLLPKEKLTVPP
ncbi:MAG TPA: S26 family signal peptidase, partial [Opitutus sp.]|nr:S26 family signal peptidase [Opitutus sp.]